MVQNMDMEPNARELYDADFFQWTMRNAELLRAARFEEADVKHIAEEIEDMGKRERRQLRSRLAVLVAHLLKWQIQVQRRSGSWSATVNEQRERLNELLTDSPSLRKYLCTTLVKTYAEAVRHASAQTGLSVSRFSPDCQFSLDQILDSTFYPE